MRKLLTIIILFAALIDGACRSVNQANLQTAPSDETEAANSESFAIPEPNINLAKPLEISTNPNDVALCDKINQIIERSEFANARWGVMAISLKDGRVVCGRDAQKLFNPASIEKTLTAMVALDKLGADFRWRTTINAANQIDAGGNLNGDLTIYGRGAPDFDEAALENLAAQLQAKGVKRVKGNVVGDESYFTGDGIGDGWTWNEIQWYYGAPASALTFRQNEADVYMENGKLTASTDFVEIENDLQPKQTGKTPAYGIKRGLADNKIYVWGSGDKATGRMAVFNPALWTAKTFKDLLAKKGIVVEGAAKSADWKSKDKLNVENSVELAAAASKTLGEIVRRMNKNSVNIYAELILRTVGKRFGVDAPDDNKQLQELRGDDSAGVSVIKKWLEDNKIATGELQIHDGSGLSRLDFVTPETFGRALVAAAQSKYADVFQQSLPVAGTDGTLGGRLSAVKGKIIAKTGSITFVNSLCGYAQATDNEIYAFAIIGNNVTRKADSSRIIDQIAASFVDVDKIVSENNKR